MHEKYAKQGLVLLTVDIDPAVDARARLPEVVGRVQQLLSRHGLAGLRNRILDEPEEVLKEKLHYSQTPLVFVFNREGRWRKFEGEVDPKEIEDLVVRFLQSS